MAAVDRLPLYSSLLRLDKPVGTLLLLWPTLTALWIAAQGTPELVLTVVFVVGTFLMRSAGCAINDAADLRYDAHVKRTADRVVARSPLDDLLFDDLEWRGDGRSCLVEHGGRVLPQLSAHRFGRFAHERHPRVVGMDEGEGVAGADGAGGAAQSRDTARGVVPPRSGVSQRTVRNRRCARIDVRIRR